MTLRGKNCSKFDNCQINKMHSIVIFLIGYIIFFTFLVYVLICGNSSTHRNGIIGKVYRIITVHIPAFFRRVFCRCLPGGAPVDKEGCIGPHGPCKYMIAIFFYAIYLFFAIVYLTSVYPKIHLIYKYPLFHKIFSIYVLPWTWVCFIIFQIADPGYINAKNVNAYLKKFPYDGAMYNPNLCPTDHIPIVARSRYDRWTKKRVSLYDHYCPWVCAVVGERTRRVFIAFLFFTIQASFYYSTGYFWVLKRFLDGFPRWPSDHIKFFDKVTDVIIVAVTFEPYLACSFFALSVIGIALSLLFVSQIMCISSNLTQIEREKIKALKKIRNNIRNPYNLGFFANWKQVFFPPKPEPCEPWSPEFDDDKNLYITAYLFVDDEENPGKLVPKRTKWILTPKKKEEDKEENKENKEENKEKTD